MASLWLVMLSFLAEVLKRKETEKESRQGKRNTSGMDEERMLFCGLHHPMDAETHNIPPGE
jgi:hypothetical protein